MSLYHLLALTQIKGIGAVHARALITHFGQNEAIFTAPVKEIARVKGIGPILAKQIFEFDDFDRIEQELRFMENHHIQALFIGDATYPKRLAQCYDAPVLLFYKGKADLNQQKVISVVGTRSATAYGKALCEELLAGLQIQRPLVISGLAYGIDAAAHKNCLNFGLSTIGVLAHGLDRIYPATHRKLAEQMLQNGGLLTEFFSATIPDRENFPKRNRIIAGMADATIVVEAHLKGGALITAELANNYNRDVFAFPGRVHDEQSNGCNYLIKTNRANLITRPEDLEYLLGWDRNSSTQARQVQIPVDLRADEKQIFEILQTSISLGIDELMLKTAFPQSKLVILLLEMEMKGLLMALPGKRYQIH